MKLFNFLAFCFIVLSFQSDFIESVKNPNTNSNNNNGGGSGTGAAGNNNNNNNNRIALRNLRRAAHRTKFPLKPIDGGLGRRKSKRAGG